MYNLILVLILNIIFHRTNKFLFRLYFLNYVHKNIKLSKYPQAINNNSFKKIIVHTVIIYI